MAFFLNRGVNVMLQRVGPTNSRVTQGKVYDVQCEGRIIDDHGQPMQPSTNDAYWMPCTRMSTDFAQQVNNKHTTNTEEGYKILKITRPTLVNGRDVTTYSDDELLDFIRHEEALINDLGGIKAKSKAITRLREQHQANIDELVKLLDSREG